MRFRGGGKGEGREGKEVDEVVSVKRNRDEAPGSEVAVPGSAEHHFSFIDM